LLDPLYSTGSQEAGGDDSEKMETIAVEIGDDKWSVGRTVDDDSGKTGSQSGPTGPSLRLGGGLEIIPGTVESLIKPWNFVKLSFS
jgi:hypothetical protein